MPIPFDSSKPGLGGEALPEGAGLSPQIVGLPVNILLVDDEIRNLNVLEGVLQDGDYHLIRAQTAEQALLLLLEGEFAAIVLDIQMPGMSGIELANLIKQRRRTQHIPIIFLTAYYQEDKDVLEGYGIGAVDYLTKPVNPQILRSKIAVFVDLFRKSRALAIINSALESEINQRHRAEQALREANNELEQRVEARAADLIRVNEELREREKALRVSESNALAASRAKDEFLARLSHELRTPLNPVLLVASEAVNNAALAADVRADFDLIARNVLLEARLIDDLLDLTRIAQGKLALERKPLEVHAVVQGALATVAADLAAKRIALTLKLDAGRHTILGDDVRLKQVFWNILANAVKFTEPEGKIVIETRLLDGDRFETRITDSGLGMTAEEIDRIFRAFAQGDHAGTAGSHKFGGLGLGMAIAHRIVELHAGSIQALSPGRGQGTTFKVCLPLFSGSTRGGGPPSPVNDAQAPESAQASPGRLCRILLVEDHQATRKALTILLMRRRYEVVTAASIEEARQMAREKAFDLLISDIGLPDGNGCDLMGELRERPGLVGIALTGYGTSEDVDRSLAAGFSAHLTKPISGEDLDRALALAGRSSTDVG